MPNSNVSGKTQICGLIGDPVEHSISPAMQNASFRKLGLDYIYLPFRVAKENVGAAIAGMRALNMRGLNVTIPHKLAVIPYLDRVDDLAEKIGAVNTIVNDNGVLTGYNTDSAGFLRALIETGVDPKGKNVVVVGAGGAARGIVFALIGNSAKLTVVNRTLTRAEELARRAREVFGRAPRVSALSRPDLAALVKEADIVVNTTNVGMHPAEGESPVPCELLRPGLTVYDIVYNPIKTRLLRDAEAAGAKTIGGVDMLVWQGALAFEKWTGHEALVEVMKEEAIRQLRRG